MPTVLDSVIGNCNVYHVCVQCCGFLFCVVIFVAFFVICRFVFRVYCGCTFDFGHLFCVHCGCIFNYGYPVFRCQTVTYRVSEIVFCLVLFFAFHIPPCRFPLTLGSGANASLFQQFVSEGCAFVVLRAQLPPGSQPTWTGSRNPVWQRG